MAVCTQSQKIDEHGYKVPRDHRPGRNQQTIVDPEDLKDAHDGRHSWIHPGAGPPFEHGKQVGNRGEGGPETRYKTKDLGTVEFGDKQA